jgi:hypothetical protein
MPEVILACVFYLGKTNIGYCSGDGEKFALKTYGVEKVMKQVFGNYGDSV